MYRFLRQPRWIIGIVVALAIVVTFVLLGNWQLRRHAEVSLDNEVRQARIAETPRELDTMIAAVGDSLDSLEYRRATVTGVFMPDSELLVRNQVEDGQAGFHVVTPFASDAGTVLVNRGWVPLSVEQPPVSAAPPPEGRVTIEIVLRLTQERPAVGREEPAGLLTVINRIDLDRLDQQFPELVPIWGQLVSPLVGDFPIAIDIPDFTDDGPHLEYAFQWYIFAVIGVVGSGILIRRNAQRRGGTG